ncbi:uncharacterized protein N7515_003228 [Penicillium bovifimosum]|uniref:Uncharacterized protein n=1 Tax=Penicillium bovifimosum TaxID=126998 RepID=A0A9W9H4B3_9EURO|nr:uncharacterized protein N7515_003228 [Penicillium bovifimosum]KAJ5138380.1 hypothetical protein N7515_003228 [Penicillium bovifimosum]
MMFVFAMVNVPLDPTIVRRIWDRFKEQMSDDLPRFLALPYHEKTMAEYGLQGPTRDWHFLIGHRFQELQEELSNDRNRSQADFDELHAQMDQGQANVVAEVVAQIEIGSDRCAVLLAWSRWDWQDSPVPRAFCVLPSQGGDCPPRSIYRTGFSATSWRSYGP